MALNSIAEVERANAEGMRVYLSDQGIDCQVRGGYFSRPKRTAEGAIRYLRIEYLAIIGDRGICIHASSRHLAFRIVYHEPRTVKIVRGFDGLVKALKGLA